MNRMSADREAGRGAENERDTAEKRDRAIGPSGGSGGTGHLFREATMALSLWRGSIRTIALSPARAPSGSAADRDLQVASGSLGEYGGGVYGTLGVLGPRRPEVRGPVVRIPPGLTGLSRRLAIRGGEKPGRSGRNQAMLSVPLDLVTSLGGKGFRTGVLSPSRTRIGSGP